jgi:cell division topological specificity factor
MSRFLDRMFGREPKESSANTAKDRLQFILVHDRINLPPEQLQAMKQEILAVISKYVLVDTERVDIALQQRNRNDSLLVAEIPLFKAREQPPAMPGSEPARVTPTDAITKPAAAETTEKAAAPISTFEETRPVKPVSTAEADTPEATDSGTGESTPEEADKDENKPEKPEA